MPVLFLSVLMIYIQTLSPCVNFEDSGEFITSSYTLSIGHPPGYPLYMLLGKLASFIPVGSAALRINFLSALFSALSAVVLYTLFLKIGTLLKIKQRQFLALTATLFLSVSSTLWDSSVTAEVYTLNLFITTVLLLCIISIYFENKDKYHYLFFYLFGVGFGNHQTIILIGIIYLVFFIKNKKYNKLIFRHYMKFILLFLLGASVYIYLPLRAGTSSLINWGDPGSIKQFFAMLFRQQYGDVGSGIEISTFLKTLLTINPVYELLKNTQTQISFNIFTLILSGLALYMVYYGSIRIKNKNIKLFFILLFCLYTFFIIFITNTPADKLFTLKVFFLPAWIGFYFLLILGMMKLFKKYSIYILPALFLILLFIIFNLHNKSHDYYTHVYAWNMLVNMGRKRIILNNIA